MTKLSLAVKLYKDKTIQTKGGNMEMQVRGPNNFPPETIYSTIEFPIKKEFLQEEIIKAWKYGQQHKIDVHCLILKHKGWENKDIENLFFSIKKAVSLDVHYSIKRIKKNKKMTVLSLFINRVENAKR